MTAAGHEVGHPASAPRNQQRHRRRLQLLKDMNPALLKQVQVLREGRMTCQVSLQCVSNAQRPRIDRMKRGRCNHDSISLGQDIRLPGNFYSLCTGYPVSTASAGMSKKRVTGSVSPR